MTTNAVGTYQGRTSRDRLREGEMILRDKNAGATTTQLMDRYGISQATVFRRLKEALDARLAITVDEYREAQDEVLDNLMARHETSLLQLDSLITQAAGRTPTGGVHSDETLERIQKLILQKTKVYDSILQVQNRRARLHGTDRPQQVDVTVTQTDQRDLELQELIREARAKAQLGQEAKA